MEKRGLASVWVLFVILLILFAAVALTMRTNAFSLVNNDLLPKITSLF